MYVLLFTTTRVMGAEQWCKEEEAREKYPFLAVWSQCRKKTYPTHLFDWDRKCGCQKLSLSLCSEQVNPAVWTSIVTELDMLELLYVDALDKDCALLSSPTEWSPPLDALAGSLEILRVRLASHQIKGFSDKT